MATLFGLVMLSHQVGGFLGAWLGGKAFEATGNYDWMWCADIVLCRRRRRWCTCRSASRVRKRCPRPHEAGNPVAGGGASGRSPHGQDQRHRHQRPTAAEAGVWVIAETDDLPTKFAKIVVTDERAAT